MSLKTARRWDLCSSCYYFINGIKVTTVKKKSSKSSNGNLVEKLDCELAPHSFWPISARCCKHTIWRCISDSSYLSSYFKVYLRAFSGWRTQLASLKGIPQDDFRWMLWVPNLMTPCCLCTYHLLFILLLWLAANSNTHAKLKIELL